MNTECRHITGAAVNIPHLPISHAITAMLCTIAAIWCMVVPAYAELSLGDESPYMTAIRKQIERSVADKSCISHNDCGAAILINRDGCRMYTPFSFLHANEDKLQALLQAYNGMALRARRDAGMTSPCQQNISEPNIMCIKNRLQSRGTCEFQNE